MVGVAISWTTFRRKNGRLSSTNLAMCLAGTCHKSIHEKHHQRSVPDNSSVHERRLPYSAHAQISPRAACVWLIAPSCTPLSGSVWAVWHPVVWLARLRSPVWSYTDEGKCSPELAKFHKRPSGNAVLSRNTFTQKSAWKTRTLRVRVVRSRSASSSNATQA